MNTFFIKEGTPILVSILKFDGSIELKTKRTKRDVLYFRSDIIFSPESEPFCLTQRDLAKQGFFGFPLTKNKAGYTALICHESSFK